LSESYAEFFNVDEEYNESDDDSDNGDSDSDDDNSGKAKIAKFEPIDDDDLPF